MDLCTAYVFSSHRERMRISINKYWMLMLLYNMFVAHAVNSVLRYECLLAIML